MSRSTPGLLFHVFLRRHTCNCNALKKRKIEELQNVDPDYTPFKRCYCFEDLVPMTSPCPIRRDAACTVKLKASSHVSKNLHLQILAGYLNFHRRTWLIGREPPVEAKPPINIQCKVRSPVGELD